MNLNRLTVPALALFLAVAWPGISKAAAASPGPQAYGQERGDWETPPGEFNDIQRRGFHDGIEGARKDFGNHRRPNVNNREEYRNPDLPRQLRKPYPEAFRRGYQMGVSRLWGAPEQPMAQPERPMPPPQQPIVQQEGGGWQAWVSRGLESEMQRRGYQEGMEGARRDFGNHRRPDPDNRDEYRQPNVPPGLQDEYREGFRRGYEATMSQLMNEGSWQGRGEDRDRAPGRFSEIQQRGYRDGMDGARKDFGNHRRPDPNNRDEFRSPNVPPALRDEYREGFRRGYEVAVTQMYGESDRR